MLREAVRFPLAGDDRNRRLLIGGGLLVISFAFLPLLALFGYVVRTIYTVADGHDETPPSFDHWGLLASDGVRAFAIYVLYTLLPTAAILTGGFIVLINPVNENVTFEQGRQLLLIGGATLPVSLYLFPAAVVEFGTRQRLLAAVSFRRLGSLWFSWRYLRSWLLAAAIVVVGYLTAVLLALTVLGLLLLPSVLFASHVSAAYVLTKGLEETLTVVSIDID